MRTGQLIVVAAAIAMMIPGLARAQEHAPRVNITEEQPGLLARAKVPADTAIARALRAVPGATITKAEIEQEDGVLIYSFDLRVPGKPGVFEVHVDAVTGKVAPVEHESVGEKGTDRGW